MLRYVNRFKYNNQFLVTLVTNPKLCAVFSKQSVTDEKPATKKTQRFS